jgi:hypothetical protein
VALGNLVIAAALLERALLADLIARRIITEGSEQTIGRQILSRLERRTAGALLDELRNLGYEDDLVEVVAPAIEGRNFFVHRILDDPAFIALVTRREGTQAQDLVTRVEASVEVIHFALAALEPGVTEGVEAVFLRVCWSWSRRLTWRRSTMPSCGPSSRPSKEFPNGLLFGSDDRAEGQGGPSLG